MYEYIIGTLEEQASDYIVLECQKIGYLLKTSASTQSELPALHTEAKIFVHQVIKDDEHALFGFATTDERAMFRTMIGISGIGPKAAIGLLSQFSRNELIAHILNNDPKAIAKAPGIGLKTASRIILELKDKFKDVILDTSDEVQVIQSNVASEAVAGLMGLGFDDSQATAMVKNVYSADLALEELIEKALRGANPLKGR